MSVAKPRILELAPIVSYPREAAPGEVYFMSVDVQPSLAGDDWPFAREEYPIRCLLDTYPLFSFEEVGEPEIVVHRFGGTYGPARFVLTANQSPMEGSIRISLVSDGGVLITTLTLDHIRITAEPVEKPKDTPTPTKPFLVDAGQMPVPAYEDVAALGAAPTETEPYEPHEQFQEPDELDEEPVPAPLPIAPEILPPRVFICHGHMDNAFASMLANRLTDAGIEISYDAFGLLPGEVWWATITREINASNIVLVIISPAALNSQWVLREFNFAWARNKFIIPVLIAPTIVPDLLTPLQYVSFLPERNQEEAFTELLRAIRGVPPFGLAMLPRLDHFIGREQEIERVLELLTPAQETGGDQPAPAVALVGMSGVGKTALATEVVRRLMARNAFPDGIVVIRCDKQTTAPAVLRQILRRFNPRRRQPAEHFTFAQLLDVAGPQLQGKRALVVLDNVEQETPIEQVVHSLRAFGLSVLLTTRDTSMERLAQSVEIPPMTDDEGALFLLRRADIQEPTADDQRYASEIVRAMGGLPLAIEQAGAYIAASSVGLAEYLETYRALQFDTPRRSDSVHYPNAVATIWYLHSNVGRANPAALDLLRLCAFLNPDAIPEEMIAGGAAILGDDLGAASSNQFQLNEIFEALARFVLIRRDSNAKTLAIHRLVQTVVQDDMNEEAQRLWAVRAVRTVNHAFPNTVTRIETWPRCERYLPQALTCAAHIKKYGLALPEAVRLLNQAGTYLREQARFHDAEQLLLQALPIREQLSGAIHLDTAQSLDGLARLYFDQYLYTAAEPLYQRALDIREQILGPEHPDIARSLNRLGLNYWYMGNHTTENKERFYVRAGELYERAWTMSVKLLGPGEPTVTLNIRNNQALLYRSQGQYEDAIKINRDILKIRRKVRGPKHLDVAQSLQNLAVTFYMLGDTRDYREAERLLNEALAIREQRLPDKHVQIARCLHYLALVCAVQHKDEEAEEYFQRALMIWDELLEDRSQIIETREEYAALLRKMGRNEEAAIIEAEIKALQDSASSED